MNCAYQYIYGATPKIISYASSFKTVTPAVYACMLQNTPELDIKRSALKGRT